MNMFSNFFVSSDYFGENVKVGTSASLLNLGKLLRTYFTGNKAKFPGTNYIYYIIEMAIR